MKKNSRSEGQITQEILVHFLIKSEKSTWTRKKSANPAELKKIREICFELLKNKVLRKIRKGNQNKVLGVQFYRPLLSKFDEWR